MSGAWIGTFPCWTHQDRTGEPGQHYFEADPGTVMSVLIDPDTGRPPDIGEDGAPVPIDPDAVARCIQAFICPDCLAAVNEERRARPDLPPPVKPGGIPWTEQP
jgi:hypothetical protein